MEPDVSMANSSQYSLFSLIPLIYTCVHDEIIISSFKLLLSKSLNTDRHPFHSPQI